MFCLLSSIQASKHNQDMKKALWEAEMELSRAVEDLQTAVGTFNSKAAELQVRIETRMLAPEGACADRHLTLCVGERS